MHGKQIFQKINHFDHLELNHLEFSIPQELPVLKNDDVRNNSLK